MMHPFSRRTFLNKTGSFSLTALGALFTTPAWSRQLQRALEAQHLNDPAAVADDEDFWYSVQQAYTTSAAIINLNNGGVAPSPKVVQEAVKRYLDFSNEAPSYYMLRILDLGREQLRRDLAAMAGCSPESIALQRNATEALETIIFGLQLKAGDEVVLSRQDYPSMINAWKQREAREGIKLVWADLQLPSEDEAYMAAAYTQLFTPRTRVVHITHMINWNGQILPVQRIAAVARKQGIAVVVDGAQTFGQIPVNLSELGADYYGASLHKWLSACIGTGLLYVRPEHITTLYPLFASVAQGESDIRKFEHLGTRPFFIEQATAKAIAFHQMIGQERKTARLHYLKNYWAEKAAALPHVTIGTSLQPRYGCALGLVSIKGIEPVALDNFLFQKYRIHTSPVRWANINGVRVTPHVYTTTKDLDVLVQALQHAATRGIS